MSKNTENYIVINGKRAELTEEQLEKLGIKPEKKNYVELFERKYNEDYYTIDGQGNTNKLREFSEVGDDKYFNIGNYCRNEAVMKQRALHETLNRLLWRASVIAGELDNEWNMSNAHYYIYRDYDSDCLRIDCNDTWKMPGMCFFPTEDSAHAALENVIVPFLKAHPDFKW